VAGKAGSENFAGKAAQTLPRMRKAKEVQMPAVDRADAACQVRHDEHDVTQNKICR
jgi:hypothetical protein